jgi:hypothetical protein
MPGQPEQQYWRQELNETRQSQIQRSPRDLVHLPANGNGLHLRAEHNAESRDLVEAEAGKLENRGAGGEPLIPGRHS